MDRINSIRRNSIDVLTKIKNRFGIITRRNNKLNSNQPKRNRKTIFNSFDKDTNNSPLMNPTKKSLFKRLSTPKVNKSLFTGLRVYILKNKLVSLLTTFTLIMLVITLVIAYKFFTRPTEVKNLANTNELISNFKTNNNSAVASGEFDSPPMGKGKHIKVNDEMVKVFEYKSTSDAAIKLRSISADGTVIDGGKIIWDFPPHFYYKDKVIALYLGTNPQTLKEMEKIFGPQFAGAK